ncbi:unnamed protein product [Amoebophrya sp. A25]|nr:unnamed protein product [Amoebophrya sp. A25]|eukprot:GSA25T00007712001.1
MATMVINQPQAGGAQQPIAVAATNVTMVPATVAQPEAPAGAPAPQAVAQTPTAATKPPAERPTLESALEHQELCKVRKVQSSFEAVRRMANQNGLDLPKQLADMGFARFEDFILQCDKFMMGCSPMAFCELGPGMVLYFDFLKYLIFLSIFILMFYAPAMFGAFQCHKNRDDYLALWSPGDPMVNSNFCSMGNAGPGGLDKAWVVWLLIFLLLLLNISTGIYGARQKRIDARCDAASVHPNDYAVFVDNLPRSGPEGCEEDRIKAYFEDNAVDRDWLCSSFPLRGSNTGKVEVAKVVIAWDIGVFASYTQKQRQLGQAYWKLLNQGVDKDDPRAVALKHQFQQVTDELKQSQMAHNLRGSGVAIVVFADQRVHRQCLEKWERSILLRFAKFLEDWCAAPDCLILFLAWLKGAPLYGGRLLTVQRAPNPSDVNWEDLGRSAWETSLQRYQLYSVMAVLIGICFACTFGLHLWGEDLKENSSSGGGTALSIIPALVVALLNAVLLYASRELTQHEYHQTKTSEDGSTTIKMTAAMVINTSFIQIIIHRDPADWFLSENGLAIGMCIMIAIHALIMPFFGFCDFAFYMRQRLFASKVNFETTKLPKDKVYEWWTPSELDLPRRYAVALKLFLTSFLIMPIFPWAMVLSAVGLGLQYAIDKWMLLNKLSRPKFTKNAQNAMNALTVMQFFIAVCAPLVFFFFVKRAFTSDLRSMYEGLTVLITLIGVASIVVPRPVWRQLTKTLLVWPGTVCEQLILGEPVPDTAMDIDYYEAQCMWGAGMKYHKVHPLYAALPEAANPENLTRENQRGNSPTLDVFSGNQQAVASNLSNVLMARQQPGQSMFMAAQPVIIPTQGIGMHQQQPGTMGNPSLGVSTSSYGSNPYMVYARNYGGPGGAMIGFSGRGSGGSAVVGDRMNTSAGSVGSGYVAQPAQPSYLAPHAGVTVPSPSPVGGGMMMAQSSTEGVGAAQLGGTQQSGPYYVIGTGGQQEQQQPAMMYQQPGAQQPVMMYQQQPGMQPQMIGQPNMGQPQMAQPQVAAQGQQAHASGRHINPAAQAAYNLADNARGVAQRIRNVYTIPSSSVQTVRR